MDEPSYLASLVDWLRQNALGDYKQCSEAADALEAQSEEIKRLRGEAPGWYAKGKICAATKKPSSR